MRRETGMGRAVTLVLLAILSTVLTAQQPAPAFEVASIKPNYSPPFQDVSMGYPPGRFLARNVHMRWIIATVYGEPRGFLVDRVLGGPTWLDDDRYDIEGKAVERDPSEALLRTMARSLLEKRLALRTHVEQRELPIYALVNDGTGKPRGQLRVSDGSDCTASRPSTEKLPECGLAPPTTTPTGLTLSANSVTMDEITSYLQSFVSRPLINRTKTAGRFSFALTVPHRFETQGAPLAGDSDALMSRALQDQLGLRLMASRGPVDVLVIDSVARPTPD